VITEDQLEQQCLGWFRDGSWEPVLNPDIAHDGSAAERASYHEVGFIGRAR
jgi:type I restriction enzyme, R subunit